MKWKIILITLGIILILVIGGMIFLRGNVEISNYEMARQALIETVQNDGVNISALKEVHCAYKPDGQNDGYKICEIFIEGVNSNGYNLIVDKPGLGYSSYITLNKNIIRNGIEYFYSNEFEFYNESYTICDGNGTICEEYNITNKRFLNWIQLPKDIKDTPTNNDREFSYRAVFEIPQYAEASYNFSINYKKDGGIDIPILLDPDISACGTLNIANSTYTLTSNVTSTGTCFTISADNVTLDCNNYWIDFSTNRTAVQYSEHYGVYTDKLNTTVKNCNIFNSNISDRVPNYDYRYAIHFNGADYGTVYNNTVNVTGNSTRGISIVNTANFNIINNSRGTSNSTAGIYLYNSHNNTIYNSTGKATYGYAIFITESHNNTISYSTGNSSSNNGLYFDRSNYTTVDNSAGNSNTGFGISVVDSWFANISYCSGTTQGPSNYYSAISFGGINSTMSYTNGTGNNSQGIWVRSRNNNLSHCISNSTSYYGIYLVEQTLKGITISDSIITSDTSTALYFLRNSNTVVTNSNITSRTGTGLVLGSASDNNTFTGLRIDSNGTLTTSLINATNNTFRNNTFISSDNGSALLTLDLNSNDNLIYHNNFTQTAGYYVNNANETNQFNTTVGSVAQGNYYYGIENLDITDNNGDGWANTGSKYPINDTNWATGWNNLGADWGPAVTVAGSSPVTFCASIANNEWYIPKGCKCYCDNSTAQLINISKCSCIAV
jgi:hypothetical protein